MNQVVMIADDLTGANANCSLMKKLGLKAASLLFLRRDQSTEDIDVLAYPTASRAISPGEAYNRVRGAVETLKRPEVKIYSKRTDSTLRGNLGPEINGMLDGLGGYRLAVAVPAYPATGRIVVGGTMLVEGRLLVDSDAGRDAKAPVTTSKVEDLFKKNFKGRVESYTLEDLSKGAAHLEAIFKSAAERRLDLVIFDAVTDADIALLAQTLLTSGIPYITVDPGPFSYELTAVSLHQENLYNKVIMSVGSVTDTTIEQLAAVIAEYSPDIVSVDARKLMDVQERQDELDRVVAAGEASLRDSDLLLLTTTPLDGGPKIDLVATAKDLGISLDDASNLISSGLGAATAALLGDGSTFAGVFMSGGDITVAFTEEMDAVGIEIKEEVFPLVAYGRLLGGRADGLRLVSKGGMAGNRDTMKLCIEKLRNDLSNEGGN